jgi:small multidrug resistance family-3 protein
VSRSGGRGPSRLDLPLNQSAGYHPSMEPALVLRTMALFLVTAVAEILGCYLPFLWLREGRSPWLLVPGAMSLAAFAWLLTLHPAMAAGRTYAAYGGVYVATAVLWLWLMDGQQPDRWDVLGASVALAGMAIIAFAPRS